MVGAIIVGAGKGRRMGNRDKILHTLSGEAVVLHSIRVFNDSQMVDSIVLVLGSHNIQQGRQLVEEHGLGEVVDICLGGNRRQDSVKNGLNHMPDTDWTIVHDGARPFVSKELINHGLEVAHETGAAVPAMPVSDTIKIVGRDLTVNQTLDRDGLWAIQTPQFFRTKLLRAAHETTHGDSKDDATMVETIGGKVRIFEGSPTNIKITTQYDLDLAEMLNSSYLVNSPNTNR